MLSKYRWIESNQKAHRKKDINIWLIDWPIILEDKNNRIRCSNAEENLKILHTAQLAGSHFN